MQIRDFELERYQSLWENHVDVNLTESGVHPMTMRELLEPEEIERVLDTRLGYGWTQGSPELRARIAALYPGATPENVLVTCGSAEANFLFCWSTLGPGDEVALMRPNYLQIEGLAEALGVRVRRFRLREEEGWRCAVDDVAAVIGADTRALIVCNPNNPTGSVLEPDDAAALANLAREHGLWLYADEVYRGAELDGRERPSVWRAGRRIAVCGGLSKSLAHPGLRLGWIVGPPELVEAAWSRNDYTTIAASILSQALAEHVLEPERRARILERNRAILRENLARLEAWVAERPDVFRFTPPRAGGLAFLRFDLPLSARALCDGLRDEESTLVVPGDCFGMEGFVRLGIGTDPVEFTEGLARFGRFVDRVRAGEYTPPALPESS